MNIFTKRTVFRPEKLSHHLNVAQGQIHSEGWNSRSVDYVTAHP